MMRWGEEDLIRAIQGLRVEGSDRPMLTWKQVIRAHIFLCRIVGIVAEDRRVWKTEIRRTDPATFGIRA